MQVDLSLRQEISALAASRYHHRFSFLACGVLGDSISDEIRNEYECRADDCQRYRIGNEIREDHERQPANERHDGLLFLAVHEVCESESTE